MQVDDVRHHRRADDPGGEQDALRPAKPGMNSASATARVGVAEEHLEDEAAMTTPTIPAITASSCGSRAAGASGSRRCRPGDEAGREQRDPEQEVEAERRADYLGDIGRHRHHLRLDPQPDRRPRENCSRQSSGRFLPVAIPSLADWVWMTIAIRFAATTTQSSR